MPELKKGDRVLFTHSKDGPILGVIGKVSKAKGSVEIIPDGAWEQTEQGWTNRYYTLNTIITRPGKLDLSTEPLPAECLPDPEDPVRLAGFSAKVTGIAMAMEGYCYNLKVLLNGKDTKIIFNEGGYGGETDYSTRGADPEVVAKFEAACEAWSTHYGVLGPNRGYIKAHDVWQDHEFGLMDLKKLGGNFPLREASKPGPWKFTFKDEDEAAATG